MEDITTIIIIAVAVILFLVVLITGYIKAPPDTAYISQVSERK